MPLILIAIGFATVLSNPALGVCCFVLAGAISRI